MKVRNDITVCIGSGHGTDVLKHSPDKTYYEHSRMRDLKYVLIGKFKELGIPVYDVNPEEKEPGLTVRANRVNKVWTDTGKKCIYISLHSNALGKGDQWYDAEFWSIWTSKGQTYADYLATDIYNVATKELPKYGFKTSAQTYNDGDPDYEENFTVLVKSNCPAVLIEQLFHSNEKCVKWLLTEESMDVLSGIVLNGVFDFFNSQRCVEKFGAASSVIETEKNEPVQCTCTCSCHNK